MTDSLLEQRLMLHPQVALRPEPFGALAYHYGNRKLVFLKLSECEIDAARWPSFERALANLHASEMLQ
jgi:mycofactocin biosynthesis protein MftB